MEPIFRAHEWLADRISWVQYPKPRARSLDGYSTGWLLRWQRRPRMNRWLAVCLPTICLFVPYIGVYLAIVCVLFLIAYFKA
jgi:hypothetical protein